jgi:hypothetical protein
MPAEVTMKRVTLAFLLTLSSVYAARASVIDYIDTSATPFVTIDGTTITGNVSGLVSNYSQIGEAIDFTFQSSVPAAGTAIISGFANLTEPGDPSTVSDRLVLTLTGGSDLIGVEFGSGANLPTIPDGAVNLGSKAEDGTLQLVATYVATNPPPTHVVDSYFIQSSVPTPLPAALPLFATGISALGLLGWRRRRKAQAGA